MPTTVAAASQPLSLTIASLQDVRLQGRENSS